MTSLPRKLTNNEKAAAAVAAALTKGAVVRGYDALGYQLTTVGRYSEAVDRGVRFAVISWRTGAELRAHSALEAAAAFVGRVGSTRALAAARGIK